MTAFAAVGRIGDCFVPANDERTPESRVKAVIARYEAIANKTRVQGCMGDDRAGKPRPYVGWRGVCNGRANNYSPLHGWHGSMGDDRAHTQVRPYVGWRGNLGKS
jgi:hypothetical protein